MHCALYNSVVRNLQNGLAGTHMTFSIIPSENSALDVAALEVSKELVAHSMVYTYS